MELDQLVDGYHRQLLDSPQGMQWHLGRGLTEATVAKRRLGYVVTPLTQSHSGYEGSPLIPYISSLGTVIELKRRSSGKPKYLRIEHQFPLPDIKQHLFNAVDAIPSPRRNQVILCEGEYDAMIASQMGFRAVGVPGVTNWRNAWNHLFTDADVVICFDGDDAGRGNAATLSHTLSQAHVANRVARMPDGQDITDVYLAGGVARFREVVGL